MSVDRCTCCNDIIPEGRQLCYKCEHKHEIFLNSKITLCQKCSRLDCSWMRDLIPVPGWEATPSKIKNGEGRKVKSYHVISCPLYERSKK